MGWLAALGGGTGAAGSAGAAGAGAAGAGAGAAGAGSAGALSGGAGALSGAAPATSALGPATSMSAFSGMGSPGTVMGAGSPGIFQQLMSSAGQYGSGVLNPSQGQAGQNVFGQLNQGQLPKFSDAVQYATQLALNDVLFRNRPQAQQALMQYQQRR